MALRELLKSRTSSLHQKGLTEAMATRIAREANPDMVMDVDDSLAAAVDDDGECEETERDERMERARMEQELE